MSTVDDINRQFPFQVSLGLDEEVSGVLDWLDSRLGQWDMYVDLYTQTVRYCFRSFEDAIAFNARFAKREVRRA
jgi:hypothetical protein